jgi:hypothetical protein
MSGDNFQGSGSVDVQPGTRSKPIYLRLKPCTASTKNDGSMPFGSTLHSAQVFAHRASDGVATTHLVLKSTQVGNTIVAYLNYSTLLTPGLYHLTARANIVVAGLSTYYREEYDFNRVMVKDR